VSSSLCARWIRGDCRQPLYCQINCFRIEVSGTGVRSCDGCFQCPQGPHGRCTVSSSGCPSFSDFVPFTDVRRHASFENEGYFVPYNGRQSSRSLPDILPAATKSTYRRPRPTVSVAATCWSNSTNAHRHSRRGEPLPAMAGNPLRYSMTCRITLTRKQNARDQIDINRGWLRSWGGHITCRFS